MHKYLTIKSGPYNDAVIPPNLFSKSSVSRMLVLNQNGTSPKSNICMLRKNSLGFINTALYKDTAKSWGLT